MDKIRWGILSTAKIGVEKVIPAMQKGLFGDVTAIASRNRKRAEEKAKLLNIPIACGSYEELLKEPKVDAVYNPLPNHLHVPWTLKALDAGKHVLCEKPIGLSSREAEKLQNAAESYPHLKVMEAFMYRFHPQWQQAKKLVREEAIGKLRTINSFFSYHNDDPANIRNRVETGGGGLMDIGCYCISLARYLFDGEPVWVSGQLEEDPKFGTDRLASGILEFEKGTSTFTCSTQLVPWQRVFILGTQGKIEIEIPFNAPPAKPTRLWFQKNNKTEEITFDICDQYMLMADGFSKAILNDHPVPTPLSDAIGNMKTIEAVKESAANGQRVYLKAPANETG